MRRIAPMPRFRQPKCNPHFPFQPAPNQLLLLLRISVVHDHDHIREVSHNGVLVLQVVEQTQSFRGEMFADHCHPQVATAAVLVAASAVLLW